MLRYVHYREAIFILCKYYTCGTFIVFIIYNALGSAKKTDIVKIEDFLTWCGQLPRDKLDKSMEFKIRNTTKNGASISNMQS